MGENSAISWTDHTFNPWWGCTKVGPGCDHCYAESFDKRVGGSHWGAGAPRRLVKDWAKPWKWQREAERTGVSPWVFCASMADVFDNEVPPGWRVRLWDLVRETPALRWIFVTKRIGNAAKMLPADWTSGAFAHVGLVSTVVTQAEADRDIPKLLATPAAWRGLSMEPLLGPVDLSAEYLGVLLGKYPFPKLERIHRTTILDMLDWVIVGGESGAGARPMHPDWALDLMRQCEAAGVSFHFKQWGTWAPYQRGSYCQPGDFLLMGDLTREEQQRLDRERAVQMWADGSTNHVKAPHADSAIMLPVGKKAAGRLLDGREHNGMPPELATTSGADREPH